MGKQYEFVYCIARAMDTIRIFVHKTMSEWAKGLAQIKMVFESNRSTALVLIKVAESLRTKNKTKEHAESFWVQKFAVRI